LIEFDTTKDAANVAKHGVPLAFPSGRVVISPTGKEDAAINAGIATGWGWQARMNATLLEAVEPGRMHA
jgi:uncharacterized protein (DUF4415 family)